MAATETVITTWPDEHARLVRVGAHNKEYAIPSRFFATVEPAEPNLPRCQLTLVVEDGHAVCEELRLERRPGGPPLSSTAIRGLKLAEYVRDAASRLGEWVIPGQGQATITLDGEVYELPTRPFDDSHVAVPIVGLGRTRDYLAAERAPRRQGRVTDETLQRVAGVYRAAYLAGEPAVIAVKNEMQVSRTTAARWVMRARERGFLRPARRGVAGEAGRRASTP